MTWWTEAACGGIDQTVFFPNTIAPGCYNQARAICARCPVLAACERDATTHPDGPRGFVAGRSPQEWASVYVGPGRGGRRRPKPCGTAAGYARHRRAGERPCEACRLAHNESKVRHYARTGT